MRRSLTWLVALPLLLAGSQAAHVLAYQLVYPGVHVRTHALLVSGHGYLDRLPLVLGIACGIALVALAVAAIDAARGRPARALPPWAFALLAPVAFVLQEVLELSFHSGTLAWQAATAPTFLPGLLLQLPFALLAWLAARMLLRAAVTAGRKLAAQPPAPRPLLPPATLPAVVAGPHARVPAHRLATRGPPLPVAV